MPAFGAKLDDLQIKLLVAWLLPWCGALSLFVFLVGIEAGFQLLVIKEGFHRATAEFAAAALEMAALKKRFSS